jgi:hypothetical protein
MKKLPAVRKHPHVERVYLCDPKDNSYMLTREEANTLGHWDFSEEDWDIIFLGESKVSLQMLCNEMTEQCYRYGGLARAQTQQLKVEKDQYGCWNCNQFSSTLAITREEANALNIWPEFSEEEWEWILCCGATDKVEVRAICMALTPAHASEAKRRALADVAALPLPHYDDGRIISGGECVPLTTAPPPTPVLESTEEEVPPPPLLTPKLIRQQAVQELPPLPTTKLIRQQAVGAPTAPTKLSLEARRWAKGYNTMLNNLPSGRESIYGFLTRTQEIGDIFQSMLASQYLLEVLQSEVGFKFAKALLQAVHNLAGDEELVTKRLADLKYYRCPHWMTAKLKHTYKRIQDLSAIMTATVSPYINKND